MSSESVKSKTKLLKGVRNEAKKIAQASRTEPSLEVSEFHLSKAAMKHKPIHVTNLTKNLKNRTAFKKTDKSIRRIAQYVKPLDKPTEKHVASKSRRAAGYNYVRNDLKKWDAVVTANRAKETMSFPLNYRHYEMEGLVEFFDKQKDQENKPKKVNDLTTTIHEMDERKQALMRIRRQQQRDGYRHHMQKKIRSKKFRKLQKKDKLKKELKEFEKLREIDPEKALEKLDELEKIRVKERITLRHRSTGKWAKNMQSKAKYNLESRKELSEQLAISRSLTEKQFVEENDDEDDTVGGENNNSDDDAEEEKVASKVQKSGSWFKSTVGDENIDDFDQMMSEMMLFQQQNKMTEETGVLNSKNGRNEVVDVVEEPAKKPVNNPQAEIVEKNVNIKKRAEKTKSINKRVNAIINEINSLDKDANSADKRSKKPKLSSDLSFPKTVRFAEVEDNEALMETTDTSLKESVLNEEHPSTTVTRYWNQDEKKKRKKVLANPVPICTDEHNVQSYVDEMGEDFGDDDIEMQNEIFEIDESQTTILPELFVDGDLVKDFEKEKQKEIAASTVPDIDLSLPGWGSWVGGKSRSIKKCRRQKKRFIIKMPKPETRRDDNKGFLIINEDLDEEKMKKHQVSELPYPFKSVADFEESIQQSIGPTFVPELTHLKLTKPKFITKMGTIIEPMDQNILLKSKSQTLSVS